MSTISTSFLSQSQKILDETDSKEFVCSFQEILKEISKSDAVTQIVFQEIFA